MSESIGLQESPAAIGSKELDESVWQAWKERHALAERRQAAAQLAAVKFVSVGVLLMTALLWGYVGPYQVVIRFALSVGALVVAGQAWRLRRYGFAAAFIAITLIFNPVVPTFALTGGWPLPLVFLTVLAFTASLIWLRDEPQLNRSTMREGPPMKADHSSWENEGGASGGLERELVGEKRRGAQE